MVYACQSVGPGERPGMRSLRDVRQTTLSILRPAQWHFSGLHRLRFAAINGGNFVSMRTPFSALQMLVYKVEHTDYIILSSSCWKPTVPGVKRYAETYEGCPCLLAQLEKMA